MDQHGHGACGAGRGLRLIMEMNLPQLVNPEQLAAMRPNMFPDAPTSPWRKTMACLADGGPSAPIGISPTRSSIYLSCCNTACTIGFSGSKRMSLSSPRGSRIREPILLRTRAI